MIKLNHKCFDISLWDISQPNTEGFWSKMSHFQEELGSLGLVGERLSSPSPGSALATPNGDHKHSRSHAPHTTSLFVSSPLARCIFGSNRRIQFLEGKSNFGLKGRTGLVSFKRRRKEWRLMELASCPPRVD